VSDLDIGEMGLVDDLGMSFPVPEPMIDDSPDSVAAALALPAGSPMPMVDQPSFLGGLSLPSLEGFGDSFSGTTMATAFDGAGADQIPEITIPLPGELGELGIMEPMSDPNGPQAFAALSTQDAPQIPSASVGLSAGFGELPYISIPEVGSPTFRDVGASVEDVMDFQLSLAPPEPSAEGFAAASDAPVAAPAPGIQASDVESRMAMQMRSLENVAAAAFGPLGTFGPDGSPQGGPSQTIHVHNLSLPAVNGREFTGSLLALSSTGSRGDLSGLKEA